MPGLRRWPMVLMRGTPYHRSSTRAAWRKSCPSCPESVPSWSCSSRKAWRFVFGNPGTTELPLMDAFATENELRYLLGLQEAAVMAMADGYAQASGKLAVCQPPRGARSRQRHGHAVRRAEGRLADPGHRRAARAELHRDRADPVGRPADHRAAAGEMVVGGAPARRPAAPRASRRQDRARAADRPGVPLAAGRHPARRRRHRPDGADARRAAHARRPAAVEAAADMLAQRASAR